MNDETMGRMGRVLDDEGCCVECGMSAGACDALTGAVARVMFGVEDEKCCDTCDHRKDQP